MSLNPGAKLFVPGVGSVTPERATTSSRIPTARTGPVMSMAFEANGSPTDTPRADETGPSVSSTESLIALTSDEDGAVELDASMLSVGGGREEDSAFGDGDATTEWVRFDNEDDEDDFENEIAARGSRGEGLDASRSSVPLLKHSSSFNGEYGANEESDKVEDLTKLREPLMTPKKTSYGTVEDGGFVENSPELVVELDPVSESEKGDVGDDATGSAAAEPLLGSSAGGVDYGAGESPSVWKEARVPLLPQIKESTYGAASPIRPIKTKRERRARRVHVLEAIPQEEDEFEVAGTSTTTLDSTPDAAAQTPLLSGKSAESPVYGATERDVFGEFVSADAEPMDLRQFLQGNDAPYESLDGDYRTPHRDEEMVDAAEVSEPQSWSGMAPPSAPPMPQFSPIYQRNALVDDLCCIIWTVARERLDLLQPLFRLQGSSIGRITLPHLRRVMYRLEPARATPRALDRLEAMLCACGYVEDITLSEFVHATHSGTLAATRLSTASGAREASILCGYLDEIIDRTPASAQTALMLGTSRHKAWLDLPRLLAKELEPEQLCLLVATMDLSDIADDNKLVDVTIYQAWLRQMQVRLHNTPLPREPLGVAPQPEPSEPTDEELRARQVKRNRLVSLWEEREERRRYTNLV